MISLLRSQTSYVISKISSWKHEGTPVCWSELQVWRCSHFKLGCRGLQFANIWYKVLYFIQTHLVWFPAVQQIHTRPPGCFTVKVLLLGFGSRSGSESVASFKSALKLISNGLFSFDEVTSDMFYFQVFSCIFFFAVVVIWMFGSLCKSSALACQTTQ